MKPGESDLVRAAEGLREGEAFLETGRHRKALASLLEAFDAVRGTAANDPEAKRLLTAIVAGLRKASTALGREDILDEKSELIFQAGLRTGELAERLIRRWALDERRVDLHAISAYVGYLEARGRLDDALRLRLMQILSYALHVRLPSRPEDVEPLVPLLERLHRIRPKLVFPRLYLGRWHYLCRRYEQARMLLARVSGKLGESPKVINIRGRCAEKLDRFEEATALYRKSLEIDRHQPHVHFRLGRMLLREALRATAETGRSG
jgi:tetratricopeptide (TPR) repeat protein